MTMSAGRTFAVRPTRQAFRPSWVFLGVLAVFVASGVMAWTRFGSVRFDVFLFVVSGWIVSLCLHEFAHAVVAYRAGDLGVAERGYLTLNPLKYTHPLLSIVLPVVFLIIGGLGLPGGAVWVDRHAARGRLTHTLISLCGPAMNVIFTLALAAPFVLGVQVEAHLEFWVGVAFLGFIQLTASVLNLVPFPGIDGGNALNPWLPQDWKKMYDLFAPYGMLVLFALLLSPKVNQYFFDFVFWLADVIGLPAWSYQVGFEMIEFWS
jgi:Zn-dependent protease